MNNIPEIKIGIVAVSRDCFPMSLSANRRAAVVASYERSMVLSMNVLLVLRMKWT